MQAFLEAEQDSLFEAYIRLASDDVHKLRFCDVDRVMGQAADVEELCKLSEYLIARRPDFDVAEMIELEAEIIAERGWKVLHSRRERR